jgi:hypothetical protein
MKILNSASVDDLKYLLWLFPVTNLHEYFPDEKGTKDDICLTIAGRRDIKKIAEFVDEYLSCSKQHIYIYKHEGKLSSIPEINLPDSEQIIKTVGKDSVSMLYIMKYKQRVIVLEPKLQEVPLIFLRPIRLEFTGQQLIVRFIKLEKNPKTYVPGQSYASVRTGLEEKPILSALEASLVDELKLKPLDLHKGIKKLWKDEFIDSSKAQYRKAISTASETMDAKKMVRKDVPELYAEIQKTTMFSTRFDEINIEDSSVSAFVIDPSRGYIDFPRYSEKKGDTDYVVSEILRHN